MNLLPRTHAPLPATRDKRTITKSHFRFSRAFRTPVPASCIQYPLPRHAPRFPQRRPRRIRRHRHRQRSGRADRRQHPGPRRPQRAAAGAALQARRHGHLVQTPRRPHLRYLAARLSVRHDQKLPPLLDAGDRRLDRAAQEHPVRQPDVLAHDHVQPRRLHAAADRASSKSRPKPVDGVLRRRPRHELLRRPVDDDAASCSRSSSPAAKTSSAC